jgi:hypothetical protein
MLNNVMIKYQLKCSDNHEFEGWFDSSTAYNEQKKKGWIICPICDSVKVDKAIMAPSIGKKSTQKKNKRTTQEKMTDMRSAYVDNKMMLAKQAHGVMRHITKYIETNFENVGDRFYKEVQKADAGERDEKFYGTPSEEEVNKLLDEGIDLFHVPKVKDN